MPPVFFVSSYARVTYLYIIYYFRGVFFGVFFLVLDGTKWNLQNFISIKITLYITRKNIIKYNEILTD